MPSCSPGPTAKTASAHAAPDAARIDRFRRHALALAGAEECLHCGSPDFRVHGRIFATLAYADRGLGTLTLTPELQQRLLADAPEWFLPAHGCWGKNGMTSVRLEAPDDVLAAALSTAHRHVAAAEDEAPPERRSTTPASAS